LDLATIFYCLKFETSLFVASYDSQGHGGGIRPRLHTGPLRTDHAENAASIFKEACLFLRGVAVDVLLLHALASTGICIPSRCLAMVIHITLLDTEEPG
jgi:hypothetical protein